MAVRFRGRLTYANVTATLALFVALSGSPNAGPGVDERTLPPPDRSADGIGVVDLQLGKLIKVLPSGTDPEQLAVSDDGTRVFIANEDAGQASVVDVASGRVVESFKIGDEPEGVSVEPFNGRVDAWFPGRLHHEVRGDLAMVVKNLGVNIRQQNGVKMSRVIPDHIERVCRNRGGVFRCSTQRQRASLVAKPVQRDLHQWQRPREMQLRLW